MSEILTAPMSGGSDSFLCDWNEIVVIANRP